MTKAYLVNSQDYYDRLMCKLEKEYYLWESGCKPSDVNVYPRHKGNTVIVATVYEEYDQNRLVYMNLDDFNEKYGIYLLDSGR